MRKMIRTRDLWSYRLLIMLAEKRKVRLYRSKGSWKGTAYVEGEDEAELDKFFEEFEKLRERLTNLLEELTVKFIVDHVEAAP